MSRNDVKLLDQGPAARFLAGAQDASGGWAYRPGASPSVEPTAAAILALRRAGGAEDALAKGVNWLTGLQHADGGWGMSAEDDESAWHTAWALLALAGESSGRTVLSRARDWLLAAPVAVGENDETQVETKKLLDIDVSLRGLPWSPYEASWVEPTGLAMLALHAAPATEQAQARADEAARYLDDRRCRGGGWNFGNPVMLGAALPPRAHTTAVSLLALARVAPERVTPEDVAALRHQMASEGGALALAWGLLALKQLSEPAADFETRLAALQQPDGSWNSNAYHTALALLAEAGKL
jgi:hypothetical protein